MTRPDAALPDIGERLAPVLARIPREQQPLLIALAERQAAERYRGWAAEPVCADHRSDLLACAAREEEIAARVEALHPDAAAIQAEIGARHPELAAINRDLFAGRTLEEQFAIQARGERLGAATWRSFARAAGGSTEQTFEACARLEEDSASVLEGILSAGLAKPRPGSSI